MIKSNKKFNFNFKHSYSAGFFGGYLEDNNCHILRHTKSDTFSGINFWIEYPLPGYLIKQYSIEFFLNETFIKESILKNYSSNSISFIFRLVYMQEIDCYFLIIFLSFEKKIVLLEKDLCFRFNNLYWKPLTIDILPDFIFGLVLISNFLLAAIPEKGLYNICPFLGNLILSKNRADLAPVYLEIKERHFFYIIKYKNTFIDLKKKKNWIIFDFIKEEVNTL